MTEKMLTYALGRGLEYYDMPVGARDRAPDVGQRLPFLALITGIVRSAPFQMRVKKGEAQPESVGRELGEQNEPDHENALIAANAAAWSGCESGAAIARCDASRADAAREIPAPSRSPA